jgi:LysM domain
MASLSAHFYVPDEHGRMTSDRACPSCGGDRLAGALASQKVLARRTRALLAAGVLAVSSVAPAAVLASEPDEEQEGAAAPDQVVSPDPPSAPGFDPGGDSEDLPFDATPSPAPLPVADAPLDPEAGTDALEQEPAMNDDAAVVVVDPGDGTGADTEAQPQAPAATDQVSSPPTPAAPSPPLPADPAVSAPSSQPSPQPSDTPAITPAGPDTHAAAPDRKRKPEPADERPQRHELAPPQTARPAPPPQVQTFTVSSGASATTTAQAAHARSTGPTVRVRNRAKRRSDRFHVVQRGESLWSIARDIVGEDASAARIAGEVERLWELNRSRIGTGDRDLLLIGTTLALR